MSAARRVVSGPRAFRRRLRRAARLPALAVWTLLVAPWTWVLALFGDGTTRLRGRIFRVWCRGVTAILDLRVRVLGAPPAAPFFLVSNHLGYLDIVTLGSVLPAVFVSKAEVARWPVMGVLAKGVNTVFVDRGRRRDLTRVNARLDALLDRAEGVVVFPECTSTDGGGVLPFRPGLLEPAVRRRRAVSHAALAYVTAPGEPPASQAVCWWGDMTFGPHFLGLLGLAGLEATIRFGGQPLWDADRRRLAERLQRAVVQDHRTLAPDGQLDAPDDAVPPAPHTARPALRPAGTAPPPLTDPDPCTASRT